MTKIAGLEKRIRRCKERIRVLEEFKYEKLTGWWVDGLHPLIESENKKLESLHDEYYVLLRNSPKQHLGEGPLLKNKMIYGSYVSGKFYQLI